MNVALRRVIRVHTVLIQIQNKSITFCIYFITLLLLILTEKKILKKKKREREREQNTDSILKFSNSQEKFTFKLLFFQMLYK